ncbi:hypothetical protein LDENG_00148330, partial [Lucifuga dentata]
CIPAFKVTLNDEGQIVAALEQSDLRENATAYAAQVSGEPWMNVGRFENSSDPPPLVFNTSFHGLCYTVGLLVKQGNSWYKPIKTASVLTSKELVPAFEVFLTAVCFLFSETQRSLIARAQKRLMLYFHSYIHSFLL